MEGVRHIVEPSVERRASVPVGSRVALELLLTHFDPRGLDAESVAFLATGGVGGFRWEDDTVAEKQPSLFDAEPEPAGAFGRAPRPNRPAEVAGELKEYSESVAGTAAAAAATEDFDRALANSFSHSARAARCRRSRPGAPFGDGAGGRVYPRRTSRARPRRFWSTRSTSRIEQMDRRERSRPGRRLLGRACARDDGLGRGRPGTVRDTGRSIFLGSEITMSCIAGNLLSDMLDNLRELIARCANWRPSSPK